MLVFRRRLSHFAGGCLVCQLCVLSLTPALCARIPSAVGGVECTCSHGDGQVCPMHHTTSTSKTKSCSCRSTTDSAAAVMARSEEHTSELQSPCNLVCRLLLEKKKKNK